MPKSCNNHTDESALLTDDSIFFLPGFKTQLNTNELVVHDIVGQKISNEQKIVGLKRNGSCSSIILHDNRESHDTDHDSKSHDGHLRLVPII
jgi:hypothetical protein